MTTKKTPQEGGASTGALELVYAAIISQKGRVMGIFDGLFKTKLDKETEFARTIAKDATRSLLNAMKKSESEDCIKLIKHPGSDNAEGLNIEIEYIGPNLAAPFYAYLIVSKLAKACGISCPEMIRMINTLDELLPQVSRAEETVKYETDK